MEDIMAKFNKTNLLKAFAVLEAIVILVLFLLLVWFCFIKGGIKAIRASADPEVRTRPFIEKEETFYQLDGRKILMHDATLGEIFQPVYADVPASELDASKFAADSKGYVFYQDENVRTKTGIDISEFQGEIDWAQVKEAGIDFAIIRAGYRSYGGGIISMDTNFDVNMAGAAAAGIDVGVYFFSQAKTTDEAIEEADAVLDAIYGYNITYPVVFDWEMIFDDQARTDDVTVESLADCCLAFCERVKSAGYVPMIYQNTHTASRKLDLPRVKDYDFWLAEYSSSPSYYYKYDMWQYTSSGEVPGIEGRVDMNICFKDYSAE